MTYLILFIIIFLFNVTLLGDDKNFFSTSQAFVDRITSNQINENEKKIILEKYQISGLALNDLQIKQIFDFTPNIKDVELLEQVLEFLSSTAKNSLTYQDIQPTLSQLINIFLKENKRTLRNIFRYSQVLCSEPVKITLMEYDCLRRSDQYLKFILTSFPEDMNQLIYDLSDDGLPSIELLNWLSGKLSLDTRNYRKILLRDTPMMLTGTTFQSSKSCLSRLLRSLAIGLTGKVLQYFRNYPMNL